MIEDLGEATSEEMVLCFIRAEIDSREYREHYAQLMASCGLDRSVLIDNADLANTVANGIRALILWSHRGYGGNAGLFEGFPTDTVWRRIALDSSEFDRLRYMNDKRWEELTHGTRAVSDGTQNYKDSPIKPDVDAILKKIARGESMQDIILVEDSYYNRFVILEGNRRATAFALARPKKIRALLGRSPSMNQWRFF